MRTRSFAALRMTLLSRFLKLPGLKAQGFLFQPQRFLSASVVEVDKLLSVRSKTFEPTRSGTSQTHASGQRLPLIRTLLKDLHRGPQAQFRTFPFVMGDRGDGFCRF